MLDNYIYNDNIAFAVLNILDYCLSRHSRIMSVRFDLRFPHNYFGDISNTPISRCMARTVQTLKRHSISAYYVWAREQVSSMHPHYHCAVFVDGHVSQNPYKVFSIAEEQWKRAIQSNVNGLTHYCKTAYDGAPQANGIMMRRDKDDYDNKIDEVINQLSYLAKASGKGVLLDGVRDFGMSRLI